MRQHAPHLAAVALALGLAAGCAHEPAADKTPLEVPQAFSQPAPQSQGAAWDPEARWWEDFGDPHLNALMDQTLARNLDLEQSWARLAQLKAVARQQGSQNWPQASLDLQGSRQQTAFQSPAGLQTFQANRFSASVSASYEVDLWGRIESLGKAADMDVLASQEDLQALAMSLTAQAAELWFNLLEQRNQMDLLQSQIKINEQLLELVQYRFGYGQATALDVYQQQQQLRATQAQLPQLQSRLNSLERQLAVLSGVAPGQLALPDSRTLPALPPLPAAGVPSELLQHRPDLRAAQLRVEGADERVAAAIADRFPALRLTGSTGFQGQELSTLLDNWVWSIAGGLTAPLLDGGRRAAEVDRQRAALRERVAAYGKLILQAILEVEDALGNEQQQQLYIDQLEEQLRISEATLDQARLQYTRGLSNYLQVLTALRSHQQNQQNLISARRQLLSSRVQLCRAMGGTWGHQLRDSQEETP